MLDDSPAPGPGAVTTRTADGRVRISVSGVLDARAAASLAAACSRVLAASPRRLELDLDGVTECTDDGVEAVSACLVLARHLDEGVAVTVATDAGRRALLGSLATV